MSDSNNSNNNNTRKNRQKTQNRVIKWFKKLRLIKNRKPLSFVAYFVIGLVLMGIVSLMAGLTYADYQYKQKIHNIPQLDYKQFAKKAKQGDIVSRRKISLYYIYGKSHNYTIYNSKNGQKYRANFAIKLKNDKKLKPYTKKIKVLPSKQNYGKIRQGFYNTAVFLATILFLLFCFQIIWTRLISSKNFFPRNLNYDINFDSIIGYNEVKKELGKIKDYYKNKNKYKKANIEVPKGILLTGPPGVGKTLFAKAVANEINCEFFIASGANFVEIYAGNGPKRVRNLFDQARLYRPSIIFIDEIDAIGSRKNGGFTDSESIKTINELLHCMDGVEENEDIVVIGATNLKDNLDEAMLRPGRFDKSIHIALPDQQTRKQMLESFLSDYNCDNNLDTEQLSYQLSQSSGADIENLVKEANNIAFEKAEEDNRKPVIDQEVIDQAIEDLALGRQTYKNSNTEEIKRIAYHELGHAVAIAHYFPKHYLHKISIVGRSMALGYTLHVDTEEKRINTQKDIKNKIKTLLAGRAAEEVFIGDISSGAYDDLQKTTELAYNMIAKFGMSDSMGLMVLMDRSGDQLSNSLDGFLKEKVYEEAKNILTEEYKEVKDLLEKHQENVHEWASTLIDEEEIKGSIIKDKIGYQNNYQEYNQKQLNQTNN